jgi:hypothetical protein
MQVVAQMAKGKDGVIEVTQMVAVYRTEKRTRTRNVGGVAVAEEYAVNTLSFVAETRHLDVKAVKVHTAGGKEVDAKDVPAKLKNQTVAFLAWDGKKVDPFYLKPLKEDTLIIVAPPEPPPADKGENPAPPER